MIQPNQIVRFLPIRGHNHGGTALCECLNDFHILRTCAPRQRQGAFYISNGGITGSLYGCALRDKDVRLISGS